MNGETISIIVTTKDRPRLLRKALESVASQKVEAKLEVLVMDDASVEDIGSMPVNIIYEKAEKSRGPYPNRNAALKKASGEYVIFLDDDDEFDNELSVQKLYEAVKGKRRMLAYGDAFMFQQDARNNFIPMILFRFDPFTVEGLIRSSGLIPLGSFMFTREDDMPVFDESMPYGADFEWQLRLTKTFEFKHVDWKILRYMRRLGGIQKQKSSIEWAQIKSRMVEKIEQTKMAVRDVR
jgi:glycosyltransferase involved in cell wall biosynthesis